MKAELEAVLDLQRSWVAQGPSDDMQLRGFYIREDIAGFVREQGTGIAARLLCDLEDVEVEGKDATGSYSRVPWVRFANRRVSPNPRTGWYAVYLFAEDGSAVYLSLNQGTQVWDGVGLRSTPLPLISQRSVWAQQAVESSPADLSGVVSSISLGTGDKSRAYEAGNVCAFAYDRASIPDADALGQDLLRMASLLQEVYRAEASGSVPGDPAPEIAEAERSVQELAGRRVPSRAGFRVNAIQRRAIELRAMALAVEYFEGIGAAVRDVSSTRPFDLGVTLDAEQLSVEVKGSTGDGSEVLLTRGEVEHHRDAFPHNALVVVSQVRLEGPPDAPEAAGGELRVLSPWTLDDVALTPVSYRYAVPIESDAEGSRRSDRRRAEARRGTGTS